MQQILSKSADRMARLFILAGFAIVGWQSSSVVNAAEHHGAHVHGKGDLDIAIDGMKVAVALHAPAESIYGFEHEAKSEADKNARDGAAKKLKNDALTLFQFAAELKCTVAEAKIEPWVKEDHDEDHDHGKHEDKDHHSKHVKSDHDEHGEHGEHGEVHANYTFACAKSPMGTKLTVTVSQAFPRLPEIEAQVISDKKQFGKTLKAGSNTLDL